MSVPLIQAQINLVNAQIAARNAKDVVIAANAALTALMPAAPSSLPAQMTEKQMLAKKLSDLQAKLAAAQAAPVTKSGP